MSTGEWIRITGKDTLPSKGEAVLVYQENSAWAHVAMGYLLSEYPMMNLSGDGVDEWEFITSTGNGSDSMTPSHWMPLPPKPEN